MAEFTASPSDLIKIAEVAQRIDANPLALAGRMLGMGQEDRKVGVPSWAWMVVVFGLGVYVGARYIKLKKE